jgi:hypothetical protein
VFAQCTEAWPTPTRCQQFYLDLRWFIEADERDD